jgi:hypothetical protein
MSLSVEVDMDLDWDVAVAVNKDFSMFRLDLNDVRHHADA